MKRLAPASILGLLLLTLTLHGQQIHRQGHEGRNVVWQQGPADVSMKNVAHEITNQTAHRGQQSEYLRFDAEQGTFVHFYYAIPKTEQLDEFTASVWIKANRPGMQLMARVAFPRERDANNLDQPLTTLIRGDVYDRVGRWWKLELRDVPKKITEQQQLLRAELKRDVNADGAYVEQIVLNTYGGKGLHELWIDDLEVGPVIGDVGQLTKRNTETGGTLASRERGPNPMPSKPKDGDAGARLQAPRTSTIEMNQDRLLVNKKPFFVRAVRYTGTPLAALRDAGFNTLVVDENVKDSVLEEAMNLSFWIVPELPITHQESPRMQVPAGLQHEVARYPHNDGVLFWLLGVGMTAEQTDLAGRAAQTIRQADPYQGRPVAGDLWDGLHAYSHRIDMVSVRRFPLLTGLELGRYREWLVQRRDLAEPGIYSWTWIQTHLPDWFTELVYGQSSEQDFDEPIGPQPEQIRLLTYVALSAGYRGLGFWSDRFLANSHQGRDRLLQMALINQELDMLEPMLSTIKDVNWISTKNPEVKAAIIRYEGGVLVIPIWLGAGAQFVPGQLSTNNLELIVPGAPMDAQVWEVSPGDVRSLKAERVAGGQKVVLPEFGLTTALVFTSDVNAVDGGLVGRLQQSARKSRRMAAQWSYDLAVEEFNKVETVNRQLEQKRITFPETSALLEEARKRLNSAREAWQRDTQTDYRTAYAEAQRALRPLRILMRLHWDRAVRQLSEPVSSPYAVSFYTLPKHWQLVEDVRASQAAANLLTSGNFESAPEQTNEKWSLQEVALDPVKLSARRVNEKPKEGQTCLKLEIKPTDPQVVPGALERTYLALVSPTYRLQPGSMVRISGWMRVPEPILASPDGVLFFDSIGGEPLAIRQTGKLEWHPFTLYRRVPSSGTINVTLALTGIGAAYFDDVRIEPLFK